MLIRRFFPFTLLCIMVVLEAAYIWGTMNNPIIEENLAQEVASVYQGTLFISPAGKTTEVRVGVERLNNVLVKVKFGVGGSDFTFRAVLSDQEEGTMMLIQSRVSRTFILSGVGGSVYKKPNVHGGFNRETGSAYFHVSVTYFDNKEVDFYFRGKPQKG